MSAVFWIAALLALALVVRAVRRSQRDLRAWLGDDPFAWPRRGRALALVGAVWFAPRVIDVARGHDLSTRARLAYAEAGVRGWRERPLLGWGPGATAWTIAEHLPVRPGVLPAGQAVADLHDLPLQLGYELGVRVRYYVYS